MFHATTSAKHLTQKKSTASGLRFAGAQPILAPKFLADRKTEHLWTSGLPHLENEGVLLDEGLSIFYFQQ